MSLPRGAERARSRSSFWSGALIVSLLGLTVGACDAGEESERGTGGAPAGQGASGGTNAAAGGSPVQVGGGGNTSSGGALPQAGTNQGGSGGALTTPGGYHVVGNKILDANGAEHRFYGVSRPSLEWNELGEAIFERDWDNIRSWGANVVRIPLNQVFWLDKPRYRSDVQGFVRDIQARGMDVILDLHWSEGPTPGKGAQQDLPDARSVDFWKSVAAAYKDDSRILFELYNEPKVQDWNLWLNGGQTGGYQAVGMKALYEAVRGTGAQNITLLGGLDWAYRLSGYPGIAGGINIALATHPYDVNTKQASRWDADWGGIAAITPVLVTEFGRLNTSADPCDPGYPKQVIDYANAKQVGWVGWAWYVAACGFPSLIADWNGTPTATGSVVKAAMLAASAGR